LTREHPRFSKAISLINLIVQLAYTYIVTTKYEAYILYILYNIHQTQCDVSLLDCISSSINQENEDPLVPSREQTWQT
jgi:hypothetical protein